MDQHQRRPPAGRTGRDPDVHPEAAHLQKAALDPPPYSFFGAQTGRPFSSRRMRIVSPLRTWRARRAEVPLIVTREPVTSIASPLARGKFCFSRKTVGPVKTSIVSLPSLSMRWVPRTPLGVSITLISWIGPFKVVSVFLSYRG